MGKEKPVSIFEVIWDEALTGFENLEYISSRLYQIYIQPCQDYILNPPKSFDAVYEATGK